MTDDSGETIRVGKITVPLETAKNWVQTYTDPKVANSRKPYAYPAYDLFEKDRNDPLHLADADLLSPGLLNVPVKLLPYYELRRIRPRLEFALADEGLQVPLTEIRGDSRVTDMVRNLYSVLDDEKPRGVLETTLSKILHRKRPQVLVLHDRWVRACYVGDGGPVRKADSRSSADYMAQITLAIRDDLAAQPEQFKALDEATDRPGELSPVRLLDIVAWMSKGVSA